MDLRADCPHQTELPTFLLAFKKNEDQRLLRQTVPEVGVSVPFPVAFMKANQVGNMWETLVASLNVTHILSGPPSSGFQRGLGHQACWGLTGGIVLLSERRPLAQSFSLFQTNTAEEKKGAKMAEAQQPGSPSASPCSEPLRKHKEQCAS